MPDTGRDLRSHAVIEFVDQCAKNRSQGTPTSPRQIVEFVDAAAAASVDPQPSGHAKRNVHLALSYAFVVLEKTPGIREVQKDFAMLVQDGRLFDRNNPFDLGVAFACGCINMRLHPEAPELPRAYHNFVLRSAAQCLVKGEVDFLNTMLSDLPLPWAIDLIQSFPKMMQWVDLLASATFSYDDDPADEFQQNAARAHQRGMLLRAIVSNDGRSGVRLAANETLRNQANIALALDHLVAQIRIDGELGWERAFHEVGKPEHGASPQSDRKVHRELVAMLGRPEYSIRDQGLTIERAIVVGTLSSSDNSFPIESDLGVSLSQMPLICQEGLLWLLGSSGSGSYAAIAAYCRNRPEETRLDTACFLSIFAGRAHAIEAFLRADVPAPLVSAIARRYRSLASRISELRDRCEAMTPEIDAGEPRIIRSIAQGLITRVEDLILGIAAKGLGVELPGPQRSQDDYKEELKRFTQFDEELVVLAAVAGVLLREPRNEGDRRSPLAILGCLDVRKAQGGSLDPDLVPQIVSISESNCLRLYGEDGAPGAHRPLVRGTVKKSNTFYTVVHSDPQVWSVPRVLAFVRIETGEDGKSTINSLNSPDDVASSRIGVSLFEHVLEIEGREREFSARASPPTDPNSLIGVYCGKYGFVDVGSFENGDRNLLRPKTPTTSGTRS